MKKFILVFLLYTAINMQGYRAKHVHKRGVMDNLNDGIKMAGQMFGINTAADVANLVAKAFSTATSNSNSNSNNNRNTKPDIITTIIQQVLSPSIRKPPTKPPPTSGESNAQDSEENHRQHQEESNEDSSTNSKKFYGKSPPPPKENSNFGLNFNTANLVTTMLRLVGFDATKLGALAINALIMIASAIGNTVLSNTISPSNANSFPLPVAENEDYGPEARDSADDHQPRNLKEGSPFDWFLQSSSPKIKRMLSDIMDPKLSDKINDMIAEHEQREGQAGCVKMLICKISPIIWGMQNSLRNRIDGNGNEEKSEEKEDSSPVQKPFNVDIFYHHMPTFKEFNEHGVKCEKLYSKHCNITPDLKAKRDRKK